MSKVVVHPVLVALAGVALALTVEVSAPAHLARAQENAEYVLTKKQTKEAKPEPAKCVPEPTPPKPPSPWQFKFRVGSMFQFSSTKGVVGQRDGSTKTFATDVHAEANWTGGKHEVRNRGDVAAVVVKTPNLARYTPASNLVELESIYQYRALPWAGPFVRAKVSTSIMVGRDLRTNTVQYELPDGTLSEERTDYRLTDPMLPTTFLETIGGFVNPVREQAFDLDFRAGIGARQVLADDQLGVQDDATTPAIVELVQLHDYQQVGLEFIVMARGEFYDKRIQYFAGGEFLLPLVRSKEPGDDRTAFEVLDKRYRIGIAYRLASWATVLYEFRVVHQPQLIDDYQIQNYFGLKASYSVN